MKLAHGSWRTGAAVTIAATLCLGTTITAVADPDGDYLGNASDHGQAAPPPPTLEEQLAQYTEPLLPNRWLVQVDGPAAIGGGNSNSVQRAQSRVVASARAEGIDVEVLTSYTSVWNGLAVEVDDDKAAALAAVPGVAGLYPVMEVTRPVEDGTEPAVEYAKGLTGAEYANEELGFTGDGIRVGVIDSGIDYNHPDLGGSGINDETADFPNSRVLWGHDFVGDAYDTRSEDPAVNTPRPDQFPDDCGGHGTHVAGIIGADGEIQGVAPEVDFGAYRIFGCDGSSASDVILAAMDMAHRDGMDVINMSLGAPFMTWPSYPTAQVADDLVDAGIVLVVSQGNEGAQGTFSGGAPSVAHNVISVGSVDNTQYIADYIISDAGQTLAYMTSTGSPAPEPGASYELVAADPILGCPGTLEEADGEGQALLVSRGTCTFHEKAATAQAAGYEAVVLHNNTAGVINATVEGDPVITIPVVTITQADGAVLASEIATSGSTTITFSEEPRAFENPTGGYQSDFSSYGLAADLTLKPDVSAPGGSIYSTYPLENGGYTTMSGTSMAAPHVAGAVALLLEAKPDLDPYEVRATLTNTADPFEWALVTGAGYTEPVHRQGGGLIDIPQAILTSTMVQESKISLGEGEAGPITTELTVRNDSAESVTYDIGVEHGVATYGPTHNPEFYILQADVEFSADTITVPANSSATFTVVISEDFGADGAIYGGWITIGNDTEEFVVPFAGLSGDYQALQALTTALMAYRTAEASLAVAEPWHTYTMVDGDFPIVYFQTDYPVSGLYFDVYEANADGSKGSKVHSNFINYATFMDEGRLSAPVSLAWDGTYQGNRGNGNNKMRRVSDGDYVLEVRVLKALGDPNNVDHWEIWDSTPFTIEYGEGADTSAGNGPGANNRGTQGNGPGSNNGKGPKKP